MTFPYKIFISGTDTDVGKTLVARTILAAAQQAGLSTAALKPIAAGCDMVDGEFKNDDALQLQQACSLSLSYAEVNPIALQAPLAPHIAAQMESRSLSADRISGFCQGVFSKKADLTVIEGAGGWRVPLNPRETVADLVKQLNTPVILVVGMRLGCLNHALLSAEAIIKDGLPLAGWVANCADKDMVKRDENIQALKTLIPAPCLATLPYSVSAQAESFIEYFDFELLINRLESMQNVIHKSVK